MIGQAGAMRDPAHHLDENAVVDFLAGAVPLEDWRAVAIHLVICAVCREVVETCRQPSDGVTSRPPNSRARVG